MQRELIAFDLDGTKCWASLPKDCKQRVKAVYFPTEEGFADQHEAIMQLLPEPIRQACALVAFASEDWNRDFSPWLAPALFKKQVDFAGGAPQTLSWLVGALLPKAEADFPIANTGDGRMIAGYSLAGLFALWSLYNTDAFSACASCSGSLWYDDFVAYATSHAPMRPARVYMSLGDREGKARNQRMASVEPATRTVAEWLAAQDCITGSAFVQNPGGHFDDVNGRIAAAIEWLVTMEA